MNSLKNKLDELVKKYETPDFINSDPIQFPRRFKDIQDIEISALISSALAYGKREAFIEKLHHIHKILGTSPYDFCQNYRREACEKYFKDFKYRFNTGKDICLLLATLHDFYSENNTMNNFVKKNLKYRDNIAKHSVTLISEGLRKNIHEKSYCYLFPSPELNSACKRLNLFLKWMVRKSPVDIGIWDCIEPKDLIIPLDTHVAKVSRALNLTKRKTNDWQTAEEITAKLREFDSFDPIKYDFALFDIGIDKVKI